MFLIAVTKNPLQDRFHNVDCIVNQTRVDSLFATIIIDRFLSHYYATATGFSIVESPPTDRQGSQSAVLSEVTFVETSHELSVFTPTYSGRPLYYHLNHLDEFYCATHISLLKTAGVPVEENTAVLPEVLAYRYVTPPTTLYKNISHLPFGSTLPISITNGQCHIRSDYKGSFPTDRLALAREPFAADRDIANITRQLSYAIEVLSPDSATLGVLLSGGLDSSILFALCRDRYGLANSYSTAYPFEAAVDDGETQYAESAAKALKSDHHVYKAENNDYLYGFLESIAIAEEPLHHLASVMMHLLLRHGLPRDRHLVINGGGADVLFGQAIQNDIYKWNSRRAYRLLARQPVRGVLGALSGVTGRGQGFVTILDEMSSNIGKDFEDPSNILFSMEMYGDGEWVSEYFDVNREEVVANRYEAIREFAGRSIYDAIAALDLTGSIAITQGLWSKLAEANKKVMYYPFTESEVMNTAFAIPWETKLRQPKGILRGVAGELKIPRFIRERRKLGFGIAPSKWATRGGVFEALVPLAAKVIDRSIIREFQAVDSKRAMTLWNILNYAIWKRLCIDGEPLDSLCEELTRSISDGP